VIATVCDNLCLITYVCYNELALVVDSTSISVLVQLVQYCGPWTFIDPVL